MSEPESSPRNAVVLVSGGMDSAVVVAMVVTYLGNRLFTWRGESSNRTREVLLFVLFNAIGLGFSVVTLTVSHDLMGLTGRLPHVPSGSPIVEG